MPRISASRLNMEDGRIDRPILKDYGETLVGGSGGTNTTATYTVDITNGNIYNLTLNANCTFTFSNPSPAGIACTITLYLKQDSTGGRTVTWPTSVKWSGDIAPTITPIAGRRDIFTFTTTNGGLTWFGMQSGQNYGAASGGYLYNLWSWGGNLFGQLGQNTATTARLSSPVQVGALANWALIVQSIRHTLAIKTDGSLWSWGYNNHGQLGQNIGVTTHHSSPVQVGTLTNWANVVGGDFFSTAIKTDGSLWSWGYNSSGQLGQNIAVATERSSPAQIGTLATWASISNGQAHIAATKTDGTLWSWGSTMTGQGGLNTNTTRNSSPVQVGTLTNWASTACGLTHVLATKTDGTLWSWGLNTNGQLGHGNVTDRSSPVQVGTLTDWSAVSAGRDSNLVKKTDGSIWAWGGNTYGELGFNISTHRSSPAQIGTLATWVNIASGDRHHIATKTDGTLWVWGWNSTGQLGLNTAITAHLSSPVQVGTLTDWVAIAGTYSNSFAFKAP